MRLIDADAFKKILSEHEMKHDKRRSFDDYDCGASNAYEHASDLLDEMPTVERPHGKWMPLGEPDDLGIHSWYICSRCWFRTWHMVDIFHFCPRCGADMREGVPE